MGCNELVLGVGEGRRPRCKRGESGGGVAITGEITAEITAEGGGSLSLSLSLARGVHARRSRLRLGVVRQMQRELGDLPG